MPESRPVTTAWPIPAEAMTVTDSAVTARTAQRGRRLRASGARRTLPAGRGRRGGVGAPPAPRTDGAGGRGGLGKGHLRDAAVRGNVITVGRYDLQPASRPRRRAMVSPIRGNVSPL
ncbi:hypothetical protein GCM10017776_37100 [Streptomyces griseoluteus]|nr:hypothetical protein GCM10017776_37100 [Streptomyces griseoluteus]